MHQRLARIDLVTHFAKSTVKLIGMAFDLYLNRIRNILLGVLMTRFPFYLHAMQQLSSAYLWAVDYVSTYFHHVLLYSRHFFFCLLMFIEIIFNWKHVVLSTYIVTFLQMIFKCSIWGTYYYSLCSSRPTFNKNNNFAFANLSI